MLRGLAGTVLVYKIAGALANRGGSLNEVYNISQWIASNVATIGVSLGHVHVGWVIKFQETRVDLCLGARNCSTDSAPFRL